MRPSGQNQSKWLQLEHDQDRQTVELLPSLGLEFQALHATDGQRHPFAVVSVHSIDLLQLPLGGLAPWTVTMGLVVAILAYGSVLQLALEAHDAQVVSKQAASPHHTHSPNYHIWTPPDNRGHPSRPSVTLDHAVQRSSNSQWHMTFHFGLCLRR